ncbi:Hypothetical protein, putative [Bodo saltans]|uniref:Uncharacterized protein n=1 Tax=Bodo saltans TaxID=75058 RepID=A0A0S4JES6_BODSA|nr:Hypothetical protein, putative [Bodo saltans]|eukprot:CUG89988.1 Hypothetical protein, putative [Bodo saltans]
MSGSRSQKISLSAGQQCTLSGEGRITIHLSDGVVEIGGVVIGANQQYPFSLSDNCSVTLVTLEGGSIVLAHPVATTVDVLKTSTEMSTVMALARKDVQRGKPTVVAVIGGPRTGKSHAAQTYANILAQGLGKRQGASAPGVYYADASGSLTPGCLSVMELQSVDGVLSESTFLWPSHTPAPDRVQCSFWLGNEHSTISAAGMPLFLHTLGQLHACCDAMAKNQTAITSTNRPVGHVVYDLPTTDGTLPRELFYQRVLEMIRPTVLIITESDKGPRDWSRSIEENIRRTSPLTEIAVVLQNQRLSASPSGSLRYSLRQYFSGTVGHSLGSAKVVVQLSKLRWYRVRPSTSTGSAYVSEAVVPSSSVVAGCLCALSHAKLDVEVPFANVCGVVFIASVSEEHDECVLVVPSCDTQLPNNVLVLASSSTEGALPWKLSADEVSEVEEAVCL